MPSFVKALPVALLAMLACSLKAPAQQHTTEPPQILEGPQAAGTAPGRPPEPALMDNDSVTRMHTAGLTDDLILQTINTQPGRYETTPDALIALKKAGLSDAVLSAMANKQRRQLTGAAAPTPVVISPVDEIGVYYKDKNGQWQPMESEVVHIKSGGFIKNTLSDGIIKVDHNGVVDGRESRLLLPRPIEFLIYTPDGVTGSEYDLLQFRLNSKNREFRVLTGGVIHSTGGAKRDEVPFKTVRIAPHSYTFSVGRDTPGGEYGILPPGTGNVTNGGKIYTFAISE